MKQGWYASYSEEDKPFNWQPTLQLESINLLLDIFFDTEKECLEWMQENLIGKEIIN